MDHLSLSGLRSFAFLTITVFHLDITALYLSLATQNAPAVPESFARNHVRWSLAPTLGSETEPATVQHRGARRDSYEMLFY